MTVCIAASTLGNEIVTASDHMLTLSDGAFTADATALKTHDVGIGWSVMYAGSDITAVPALVRRIQSQLDAHVAATMDWCAESTTSAGCRQLFLPAKDQQRSVTHHRAHSVVVVGRSVAVEHISTVAPAGA
jgi:hypothetical protein